MDINFAFTLCLILLCLLHFSPFFGGGTFLVEEYLFLKPMCKNGYAFMHNEFTSVAESKRNVFAF